MEPGAFTKTSALGVEEQRVNVILDFIRRFGQLGRCLSCGGASSHLGGLECLDGALKRCFPIGGKLGSIAVKIGHRGDFDMEVVEGLSDGDSVILHPGTDIDINEGTRVLPKERMKG